MSWLKEKETLRFNNFYLSLNLAILVNLYNSLNRILAFTVYFVLEIVELIICTLKEIISQNNFVFKNVCFWRQND